MYSLSTCLVYAVFGSPASGARAFTLPLTGVIRMESRRQALEIPHELREMVDPELDILVRLMEALRAVLFHAGIFGYVLRERGLDLEKAPRTFLDTTSFLKLLSTLMTARASR